MKNSYEYNEQKKSAIVFLSIALALFLGCIGFFTWHTVRMRDYELNYAQTEGTVIDVEKRASSSGNGGHRTYYYLVVSYTFDGQEYRFTDRTGYRYITQDMVDNPVQIYVSLQNPAQAEVLTSSDFVSIIFACFFAFSCVTYSVGMNLLLHSTKGTSFTRRLLFVWGIEILLGVAFLSLFWLGLPLSGFGEVFVRIDGAVGVSVIMGLVLCVSLLDGIITYKLRSKIGR